MKRKHNEYEDALIVEEILSFHQEKRTALKSVRTGIAMLAVQVSFMGLMVILPAFRADMASHWIVPLVAVNLLFFLLSACCVVYPLIRIRRLDQKISKFEQVRTFLKH